MIITVDIGNSNIVFGCSEKDGSRMQLGRVLTDSSKSADEYAVILKGLMELCGVRADHVDGAIISSVVPPLTRKLEKVLYRLAGVRALVVSGAMKTGLKIGLEGDGDVDLLAADLISGAVGALAGYQPPLIIFDMGTATTVSVIDADANFLGGAIMPGVVVSLNALSSGTAQLPEVSLEAPPYCIGRSTVECMRSGSIYGTAASLDGMIDRIEKELGQRATAVATGGIAPLILPYCTHSIIRDDDLLLKGLAVLYEMNQ